MSKVIKAMEEVLVEMTGKTFEYAKSVHYVKEFKIDPVEETFAITTNLNTFTRKIEAFEDFMGYWDPVTKISTPATIPAQVPVQVMEQENSTADKLVGILMDSIVKVQADKGYINQAKAINNDVNSITNIMKLKMDLYKESKKAHR
jgi:hypothetical protein